MAIHTIIGNGNGLEIVTPENVIATGIGPFGSGTINIEKQNEDGTWYAVPEASYTANFSVEIKNNARAKFRYAMSGSTTPSVVMEIQ